VDDGVRSDDGRNVNGDVIAADVGGRGSTSVVICGVVAADVGGRRSTSVDLDRFGWSSEWV
jgi:hypothetical protein